MDTGSWVKRGSANRPWSKSVCLLLALLGVLSSTGLYAQGTAFTYQGRLNGGGSPAEGRYDFTFALFSNSTNNTQVGSTVTNLSVAVTNGLFTILLDFGSVFTANASWLAVGVRTNGVGGFTPLTPRQPITPAPYAITARSVTGGVAASQVTGTLAVTRLPALVLTNGGTNVNLSGNFTGNGVGLTNIPWSAVARVPPGMALVPAGSFMMGDSLDAEPDALPTVSTSVSAFFMDVNPITLSHWQAVYFWATNHGYGFAHPGAAKAANHPVFAVNWHDAVKWCNARSEQLGRTPAYYTDGTLTTVYRSGELDLTNGCVKWTTNGFRLPTEAEWEKAARGALGGQRFPWGNFINENLANYNGAPTSYPYDFGPGGYNVIGSLGGASPATSPVGSFAANGYGLYDLCGNVYHWCWDWYGTPYAGGTDPRGPASGANRVVRGGDWNSFAANCRVAARASGNPVVNAGFGFRAVLPLAGNQP